MATGGNGGARPGGRADPLAIAIALIALTALLLASCGGDAPVDSASAAADTVGTATTATMATTASTAPTGATTSVPTDPSTSGRLRITQHQTACCYPTGQVSWLVVRDSDGHEVFQRRFRSVTDVFPVMDERLAPGRYHLVSAQQLCGATCARLGATTDQCSIDLDVVAGVDGFLTVGVAPGSGCLFVATPGPQASTVPDEVALTRAEADCGLDVSLADAASSGANVRVPTGRLCLASANRQRTTAWLMADEPGDIPGTTVVVVYRTNADRTVDVYRVVEVFDPVWSWSRSRCTTMAPDRVRGFLVQGCAPPEAVPVA